MPSRSPTRQDIFTGATADGVGTGVLVQDFKNLQVQFAVSDEPNLKIRFQASLQAPDDKPNFALAPTPTNMWDYVAAFDYQDPTKVILGDAGIVCSTADVMNLLVNVEGIVWLNIEISQRSAGTVSATSIGYNNQ